MTLKRAYVLASFLVGLVSPVQAITSQVGSPYDFGVGVEMGQPFGVTAKYWLTPSLAVDGASGYHWNHNFDVHADYLWHSFSSFDISSGRLPFYAGLGARILLGDSSQLGMRLPIGASYLFSSSPLETFVELAPIIRVTSGFGLDLDGLVGVRFYINYLK